jgi:hypothetical protein
MVGRISQKNERKKYEEKKLIHCPRVPVVPVVGRLSYLSLRFLWWAEFHTKNGKKKSEKKLIHCLPVPVVLVVGRLSH